MVLSGVASDAHTWNLVFLQLLLEELGHRVVNLGPCVPESLLVEQCARRRPDLVVLSSVNGHGFQDGLRAIAALRARPELADTPTVIGGKLSTTGVADGTLSRRLMVAGFDAVFEDGHTEFGDFRGYLATVRPRVLP